MIVEKRDQGVKVHPALGLNILYAALRPGSTSILCARCGLHVEEKAGLSADILPGAGHIDSKLRKKRLLNNALKDAVCCTKSPSAGGNANEPIEP